LMLANKAIGAYRKQVAQSRLLAERQIRLG
jgi:hypothetical protein